MSANILAHDNPPDETHVIRFAEREDIPELVTLHRRVFGPPEGDPPPDFDYETLLFDHPWFDPEIRSILYEKDGRILGSMGVIARPMIFEGEKIRVAVPTRFMVDAEQGGGLVAIQLLRRLFRMPADLAVNDSSNDLARDVWVRAGGDVFTFSSLRWRRLLKPAERFRRRVRARPSTATTIGTRLLRPATRLSDAMLARMGWNDFAMPDGIDMEPTFDPARILALLREVSRKSSLRPVYDEDAFIWQLREFRRMARHRRPGALMVTDERGRDIGWHLFHDHDSGVRSTMQLAALPGRESAVFAAALDAARGDGRIELSGRLDSAFMAAVAAERTTLELGNPWSLTRTGDERIRAALDRGDAFFSRLEGEWW